MTKVPSTANNASSATAKFTRDQFQFPDDINS